MVGKMINVFFLRRWVFVEVALESGKSREDFFGSTKNGDSNGRFEPQLIPSARRDSRDSTKKFWPCTCEA
jgi:hypothetical protein